MCIRDSSLSVPASSLPFPLCLSPSLIHYIPVHQSEIGFIHPQCTISVTDNGFPQPRVTTTQATITVAREPAPTFPLGPYVATVDESDPAGMSVIRVVASKSSSVTVRHPSPALAIFLQLRIISAATEAQAILRWFHIFH